MEASKHIPFLILYQFFENLHLTLYQFSGKLYPTYVKIVKTDTFPYTNTSKIETLPDDTSPYVNYSASPRDESCQLSVIPG